jgi:hypothetical protein
LGQEKTKLCHDKMIYGTEQGHILGQEKWTYGHDETMFLAEQGDFLGQEKLTLSLIEKNYGT